MKLTEQKINSKKIFELALIKSKTYSNNKNGKKIKNVPRNLLNDLMIDLKKSLHIIFKYHRNNKRILFIGVPKKIESMINLNTIHTALPNGLDITRKQIINNFLLNSSKLNKHVFSNTKFLLSKLQKRPELIVIFTSEKKDQIIKENKLAKIPIIEFNYKEEKRDWDYFYRIPGNFNSNRNNIFFMLINSLLNKSYKKN